MSDVKIFEAEVGTRPSSPDAKGFARCAACGQKDQSGFKPLYEVGEEVYVEDKQGVCVVQSIEQTMPGVFRYTLVRAEVFLAPQQYLTKKVPHRATGRVIAVIKRLVIVESPLGTRPDGSRCTLEEMAINQAYARKCVSDCIRRGEAPFASHVFYPLVLDDTVPEERKAGMEAGFAWAEAAAAFVRETRPKNPLVAVYVDNGITGGMKMGIVMHEANGLRFEYRKLYPEPHTLTPDV